MTKEKQPFEDVYPIKNGVFIHCHVEMVPFPGNFVHFQSGSNETLDKGPWLFRVYRG